MASASHRKTCPGFLRKVLRPVKAATALACTAAFSLLNLLAVHCMCIAPETARARLSFWKFHWRPSWPPANRISTAMGLTTVALIDDSISRNLHAHTRRQTAHPDRG